MSAPLARTVLMVRPAAFGFSADAADSNVFQHRPTEPVHVAALAEFDGVVAALRAEGVEVIVVEDTPSPPKPDAVFPNNWVSCHAEGTRIVYPMAVPSRRAERRADVLAMLGGRVVDLSGLEAAGSFVEGTGSLVFDHGAKVAYACRSARTTDAGVAAVCAVLGYRPVAFTCELDGTGVYHTNVVLALTPGLALWFGAGAGEGRERVEAELRAAGRELLVLTEAQVRSFCGNVLAVQGANGPVTVLSRTAWAAFTPAQRERLGRVCVVDVPTIERVGGGGARCMLAEVVGASRSASSTSGR